MKAMLSFTVVLVVDRRGLSLDCLPEETNGPLL